MLNVECSEAGKTFNIQHSTSNAQPAAPESTVTKTINLTSPWKRVKYKDMIREKAGADWFETSPAERRQRAHDLGAEIGKEYEDFEVTGAVFEKLIEPTLIQPTFVTHLPKELVPLAKLSPDDASGESSDTGSTRAPSLPSATLRTICNNHARGFSPRKPAK